MSEAPAYYHEPTNLVDSATKFPVIEIFGPTIQGEGAMVGVKTMFIRFGGCDFRCTSCDSLHAVIPEAVKRNATMMNAAEIVEALNIARADKGCEWVTISGGNPAMWDLTCVVQLLVEEGYRVAVETQGSIWRDWLEDVHLLTVCPKGPGMGERFQQLQFEAFLHKLKWTETEVCFKAVIFSQQDFEFAVSLDEILHAEPLTFKHSRYLSLGNDHPPRLLSNGKPNGDTPMDLPRYLLEKYRILLEDYLMDSRLQDWKFLPQLHVLVWANQVGV